MLYIVGDKKIRVSESKLHYINEGLEGAVYNFRGNALKLYHNYKFIDNEDKKIRLDLKTCRHLSALKPQRFYLPKQIYLTKKRNLGGYECDLVEGLENIYEAKCDHFLNECSIIKNDIFYLSDNYVEIDDLCLENFIYNGKMNFIDPGSYVVHFDMLEKGIYPANIEGINFERINEFIRNYIILNHCSDMIEDDYNYSLLYPQLRYDFCGHNCSEVYIGDILEKYMNPNDTLDEFVKKYVKEKIR